MEHESIKQLFQNIEQINSLKDPIIMQNQENRCIAVIGPTGSGKSALVNVLTNQEVHVILYDDCIVQLEGENIGDGCTSITRFPRALSNENLTNIFCDCPGFFDTDGILQELKNALMINILFQKKENFDSKFKILITISYADILSARSINVKQTFQLFENMIKNNVDYKNGIGLVITKTPENIKPSACLNYLKKNSNEIISSWCNFFLQNNCDHVFLFPTPSLNNVDGFYNDFPDKSRLEEFLNDNQIDIVNPHLEVGLSENAACTLNSIVVNESVCINSKIAQLFVILRELFNRENDISVLTNILNVFNDIENKDFATINEFILLIQEEIQIDQSEYDFSGIQKLEKICQLSGEILHNENFKNCVRLAIINQLPQLKAQLNIDFSNKVQNENLKQQMNSVSDQNQQIQQQMNSVNNINENLRQQINTVNDRNQRIQQQMNSVNNINENLRRQINTVNNRNQIIQQQIYSVNNTNENLRQQINVLNDHSQKLQKEHELLQSQNEELESNIYLMNEEQQYSTFQEKCENVISIGSGFVGFVLGGPITGAITQISTKVGYKLGKIIGEKLASNDSI